MIDESNVGKCSVGHLISFGSFETRRKKLNKKFVQCFSLSCCDTVKVAQESM